jgi:hypothetical protein
MAIVSALLVVSIVLASTPDVLAYMVYDDGQAVHETLVNFAMGLYQQHGLSNELPAYLATIRTGAEHEDLLDHVNDRQFVYLTQTHFWDGDKGPDDPVDNLIDP